MIEQSIPEHWQIMVVSAMTTEARFTKMMKWLEENKSIDYDSMNLVKAVIKIKEETKEVIH